MRVIIVGLGKIGTSILDRLVQEKHDVIAIDDKSNVVYEVANAYDVMAICGNGTSYEQLKIAGADKCDLFIAVTGSDELNMLACYAAKKMGAKNTVARIRNSEYNDESLAFMKKHLDISLVINPEKLISETIYNLLKIPSAINVERFTSRSAEMLELVVKENSVLNGKSLAELRRKISENFLVCIVERGSEVYIPYGQTVLSAGDKIYVMVKQTSLNAILKSFGLLQKECKNVIIVGASKTAHYLSEMLTAERSSVKIIEKAEDKCADFLDGTNRNITMIHGDAMSQDLLIEEGIDKADAFVALTGQDEENILMTIYAASREVPKVIAKVNRAELGTIAQNLGLECIVTPKAIVSDIIVRYARALTNTMGSKVKTLYSLAGGAAEALEFDVMEDFGYTGTPLRNLELKKDVLIAGIVRGSKTILPGGDDVIMAGDRVIIIAKDEKIYALSDIIK